jgi:uncharacterized protein (DUF983 family)
MAEIADLLMLSGMVRLCPDCGDERIFVPIDTPDDAAMCCTMCGAALLVDPLVDRALAAEHVA